MILIGSIKFIKLMTTNEVINAQKARHFDKILFNLSMDNHIAIFVGIN